MPCYEPNDSEYLRAMYEQPEKNKNNEKHVQRQQDQIKWLEGALCAIITELEKHQLADEIIKTASINGSIDLYKFWNIHKKEDEERLKRELDKMSEHERQVIKRLLNEMV